MSAELLELELVDVFVREFWYTIVTEDVKDDKVIEESESGRDVL